MTRVRIGISGWRYPGWRGDFYPKGLRQATELAYAADRFDTIEINGTHYSLQRPGSFRRWYDETPRGFVFAVKGSRFITHMKQLNDIGPPLANFFASGVLALEEKLGPFLWQFAPRFRFNAEKFDAFLSALPHDAESAASLAHHHDARLNGRAFMTINKNHRLRHAVEVRHESFLDAGFVAQLRRHKVALVFADTVDFPYAEDVTADFTYLRLHGAEKLYASGYSDDALDHWAARIRSWRAGTQPDDAKLIDPATKPSRHSRDVYVYFDNDAKVHAPYNAQGLRQRVTR